MPHLESVNLRHNHAFISIGHTIITFFLGMYGIFQPLYFYTQGVPVLAIIGYEVFFWTLSIVVVLPNYFITARLGVRLSFVVSWFARMLFLTALALIGFLIEHYSLVLVLFLLGIVQRIAVGYYWTPFHCLFAYSFDGEHEAKSLGSLLALGRISAIISPIVGASLLLLLPTFWFFLFIATGFTIGLSMYFFVSLPQKSFMRIYPKRIMKYCISKENFPYFTEGLIGRSQMFIWPFLLGLREVSLAVMGGLFTATNFARTLICVLIGNSLDKHHSWLRLIQGIGMSFMSISFFIRGFFFNLFFAGIGQAIGGIGHTVYSLPTLTSMYDKANPSDVTTPIAVREIVLNFGRLTASVLVLVLVLTFGEIHGLSIALFLVGLWCALRSLYFFRRGKLER